MTLNLSQAASDYTIIAQAIRYIEKHQRSQPTLAEIAKSVNLSEYHFQRLFTRWVGISPKRFLQFLTKENAKRLLAEGSLLDAAYQSGLSGTGRLHDLFVQTEALTPGEIKQKGAGLEIRYGSHPTPFGQTLIAATERGICRLAFDANNALATLKADFGNATLILDAAHTQNLIEKIFSSSSDGTPLTLDLRGTNFQIQVWEALLRIPTGEVTTYQSIAAAIGSPKASRAVGSAVGKNPVPLLIPCHRVIRATGEFGQYAFGSTRKKAILGWEMAQSSQSLSGDVATA
ncbi:MAG: methylated-DNA--[protein]-cysteine S-methyltransferase [Anaerolineae bacterium]|jgi:AraC family transcriptional regulator, regulatory protein of adaptative response / methylated-DNA-[protein]-cysteine methyltransferase|nr:methylated-DNA--[protein]-cysteine S-methyltransferase [Anaerolineae bacterium]MBT7070486.1 methylated-DNA--[protein]-cysteine S-methyltransferase [Anaerolineae bacterium]MBT7324985.1 methylated-DNA--[protein]-cysteine S-methyltransferase [Anaerolineae bacterium]